MLHIYFIPTKSTPDPGVVKLMHSEYHFQYIMHTVTFKCTLLEGYREYVGSGIIFSTDYHSSQNDVMICLFMVKFIWIKNTFWFSVCGEDLCDMSFNLSWDLIKVVVTVSDVSTKCLMFELASSGTSCWPQLTEWRSVTLGWWGRCPTTMSTMSCRSIARSPLHGG